MSDWPGTCYSQGCSSFLEEESYHVLGLRASATNAQFHVIPGTEPRASCMLSKHSMNCAIVPASGAFHLFACFCFSGHCFNKY